MDKLRTGHGFDVHQLVPDRKLIIGGMHIPFERGLLGHSDADVLLHAIADALLGAAGLPDIGHQFPPSEMKYKNADSLVLLGRVMEMVRQAGFPTVYNIDSTIMAQRPKLAEYLQAMREKIAPVLGVEVSQVGIKATTTEHLGYVGREEGIAASAVCLISSHE